MAWEHVKQFLSGSWKKIEASIKFPASVLSEPTGEGSASRVCFFLVTTTVCAVLGGHLCLRHALPDAGTLTGLAGLLTAGAAGYGTNKLSGK